MKLEINIKLEANIAVRILHINIEEYIGRYDDK